VAIETVLPKNGQDLSFEIDAFLATIRWQAKAKQKDTIESCEQQVTQD